MFGASQVVLVVKNWPANAGDMRYRFHPLLCLLRIYEVYY